ncbi:hypothetical protein [Stenotrophomonas riyadhensis]|uniref:hypothetical protein n=1 Tax=Stenotrophomonas riyadhensis TaxID=2859893 RepID=UPI003305EAB5
MATEVEPLISKRDAVIAAAAAFGFGGIITAVALAGSDIPLKCIDAGNAADWLAAIGTWAAAGGALAVGYGANRFARESHHQRIAQELSDRKAARVERARRIELIRLRLKRAMSLPIAFGALESVEKYEDLEASDIHTIFRVLKRTIPGIFWPPEELVLLSAANQDRLAVIEMLLGALDEIVDMGLVGEESDDARLVKSAIQTALKAADDIAKKAESLRVELGEDSSE